jgi:ABC-type glutathione transport system ATPase component
VKDNDEWIKEQDEKPVLTSAIKVIANENIKNISKWRSSNPGCTHSDSRKNDLYLKIVSNAMSGSSSDETFKNIIAEKFSGVPVILEHQSQDEIATQYKESKLDTYIGDNGSKLSGGQKQRLGIARALITEPKILVMDESTSSLDGETENNLTNAIISLKGKTTLILIAHRLSTVRNADKIIYMEDGQIIASGSFNEVRERVPDFDKQSKLMGL